MSTILKLERKLRDRWRRLARCLQWTVIGLAFLLAGLRILLPFAITQYVNERLSLIPEYSGRIGKVKVHLWRGAYEIRDIAIFKSTGKVPVPLFSAPDVELSIQWAELLHGSMVGEVLVKRPEVNFVAGPTPEQSQAGVNKAWGKTLASFFPFRINKFEIRNGQVRFRNFHATYPVNIYVTNLFCIATNFDQYEKRAIKISLRV